MFEALLEAIVADRTATINPIFQIMLVYQAKVDWLFASTLFERETMQPYADRLLHLMRAVPDPQRFPSWFNHNAQEFC